MSAVRDTFRPEFLNRIDDVIVFDKLGRDDLRRIVDIQMESLRRRLSDRGLELAISPEAMDVLADRGYDPVYGARPLKRVLQKHLADPIATAILEGRYVDGDTVKVSVEGEQLSLG